MKNKLFTDNELAREFLIQKPNAAIKQLAKIVEFPMFAQLLAHPELQGKHFVFPKRSTLERTLMIARIKEHLKTLKVGGKTFELRVKQLSQLYGIKPYLIKRMFMKTKKKR